VIVVADTSPLRYLILIEHVHVLPALYGHVIVPPAVNVELNQEPTPDLVKTWLANRPEWLQVQAPMRALTSSGSVLGAGEREALALAAELSADALLMDDRDARREAQRLSVPVLGTLRVLVDASEHGLAHLSAAFDRLRQTNFRASEERATAQAASGASGAPGGNVNVKRPWKRHALVSL
jgi:predicted nucleic acid-binding protein